MWSLGWCGLGWSGLVWAALRWAGSALCSGRGQVEGVEGEAWAGRARAGEGKPAVGPENILWAWVWVWVWAWVDTEPVLSTSSTSRMLMPANARRPERT